MTVGMPAARALIRVEDVTVLVFSALLRGSPKFRRAVRLHGSAQARTHEL